MDDIYLPVKICNIDEPKKCLKLKLLVDSGATLTVIQTEKLKKIGIKPKIKVDLTLADGRIIKRYASDARFIIKRKSTVGGVVFGIKSDDEVLGVTVLETMGWSLDFSTGKLKHKKLRF